MMAVARRHRPARTEFWPAFVDVLKIERRLDVRAVGEAELLFSLFEKLRCVVIPASLAQEVVEHRDLLFVRPASVGITPLERCFIARACEHPFPQCLVTHAEKPAGTSVEETRLAVAEIVSGRQPAGRIETDLVDHPAEEHESTDRFVRAAQSRNGHVHIV